MRYSVIIPVYNAKETLRRCLDSLVGQQFSNYELLLINDGSTDGSDAICREYASTYPVHILVFGILQKKMAVCLQRETWGLSKQKANTSCLWTAMIMCRLIILHRFLPH